MGERLVGSTMGHWNKRTWPLSERGNGAFGCPITVSPRGWSRDPQHPRQVHCYILLFSSGAEL